MHNKAEGGSMRQPGKGKTDKQIIKEIMENIGADFTEEENEILDGMEII